MVDDEEGGRPARTEWHMRRLQALADSINGAALRYSIAIGTTQAALSTVQGAEAGNITAQIDNPNTDRSCHQWKRECCGRALIVTFLIDGAADLSSNTGNQLEADPFSLRFCIITNRVTILAATDEEAKERAKQLVDGQTIELWQEGRKVAQFDPRQ